MCFGRWHPVPIAMAPPDGERATRILVPEARLMMMACNRLSATTSRFSNVQVAIAPAMRIAHRSARFQLDLMQVNPLTVTVRRFTVCTRWVVTSKPPRVPTVLLEVTSRAWILSDRPTFCSAGATQVLKCLQSGVISGRPQLLKLQTSVSGCLFSNELICGEFGL